ncbi:MAG: hypothetical protein LBP55_09420 [Candidatus Adiutrix sp.]|jgi:hypothetical protein|nr:hypothetical protein [Candidatus Adiutrix sp.]
MSSFPLFDRSRLSLRPLNDREHDLHLTAILDLKETAFPDKLGQVAEAMLEARRRGAPTIFMMGAHVIRAGVQRYLIDLLERGLITALAGNGACAIHDFELARIGATTESVARYIREGQFGLWAELDELNETFKKGAAKGLGAGEAVGRLINERNFPHRDISLFAAANRLKIPFTVHMGIGSDILHELPDCDGAALGAVSYTDFLIFAAIMEKLEGGVFGNFGSAVVGPEVFLKALAMARNAAGGPVGGPRRFTTLVCDLHDLPEGGVREADRASALYYYRPWKTILVRTVSDGGQGFYVKGRHEDTIPGLWSAVKAAEKGGNKSHAPVKTAV